MASLMNSDPQPTNPLSLLTTLTPLASYALQHFAEKENRIQHMFHVDTEKKNNQQQNPQIVSKLYPKIVPKKSKWRNSIDMAT